ncbi:MAG TPA: DinB family protein [Chitinophagaceae bacterium]|jgi:hypothetical protein|nr:DinB family protein [Chitinophagaceae bacterium]
MTKSIYHSELILQLNDRLFINALEGITEEQAKERLSDHNNPISWIAAHTLSSRYFMLVFLGKPAENPYRHLFENFKPFDPSLNYPTLGEVKKEWKKVSDLLKDALKSVTEQQLAGESPIKAPVADSTNEGTLAFLAEHESYEIGQLGFLKKYFTGEAMSYN